MLTLASRILVVSFTSLPLLPKRQSQISILDGLRADRDFFEKKKTLASVRNVTPALQYVVNQYTEGNTNHV
jgi:hypothetical protein